MTIGEKITHLRTSLGLSQEALADKLNVSRQSVSKWEMDLAQPQIDKILLLCNLFQISTDELLYDKITIQKTDKEGKKMSGGHASTILKSEPKDDFFGPGHNGEIITDAKGQDYILYHCHNRVDGKDMGRHTLLQRIYWDKEGWPYFETGKPLIIEQMPYTGRK